MTEVLAQVLTRAQADAYLGNRSAAGIEPARASGFAVRLGDLKGLTASQILAVAHAEHPDASGLPASYSTDPLPMLVFAVGPDARACTVDSAATVIGGTVDFSRFVPPFTGQGRVSADDLLAVEYLVDGSALLPCGSELWMVSGTERTLVGRLGPGPDGRPIWSPSGSAGAVALATEGEHQLFAEVAGRRVPAWEVGEDALGVLAPDSRAAWLCFPAAAEYVTTPAGCLAIYPLSHVDAVLRAETRVQWRGHELIAEAFGELEVSVLHVGAPLPGMAEAGFVGDQYHGFRARLPRTEVSGADPQVTRYEPGSRPERTDSAAPFLPGENRRFHTDFLVEAGQAPLPVWWAEDPAAQPTAALRAPDVRAALVMHEGLATRWSDGEGGVLLPVQGAELAGAATRIETDGETFLVEGADGQRLVARPVGSRSDAQPVLIEPERVLAREDALFVIRKG